MASHAPIPEQTSPTAGLSSLVANDALLDDLIAAATADFPGRNELRNARAAVLARMREPVGPTDLTHLIAHTWATKRAEYVLLPVGGQRYAVGQPAERRTVFEGSTRDACQAWIDRQCAEAVLGVVRDPTDAMIWAAFEATALDDAWHIDCSEHWAKSFRAAINAATTSETQP